MKIEAGLVLDDRYRLLSRIAVGGMGEVWRARDFKLNIIVAVKILRDELVGQEQFLKRLRVEANNAKKVVHPNLARVLDHNETNGRGWIVMEYVDGQPLSAMLKKSGTIPLRKLLPILIQISDALDALHTVGVIHRDIKPANVLITRNGVVKLTDFGISKSISQDNITAIGMVMGTAQYLAPEQVLGENASFCGDIYALGIIAYEAVVGKRPYTGKTQVDIAFAHVNEPLPALPVFVPPVFAGVIECMLAKSPEDRYKSAKVLSAQLRRVLLQVCPDAVVPKGEVTVFERPLTRRQTQQVPRISADKSVAQSQLSQAASSFDSDSENKNSSLPENNVKTNYVTCPAFSSDNFNKDDSKNMPKHSFSHKIFPEKINISGDRIKNAQFIAENLDKDMSFEQLLRSSRNRKHSSRVVSQFSQNAQKTVQNQNNIHDNVQKTNLSRRNNVTVYKAGEQRRNKIKFVIVFLLILLLLIFVAYKGVTSILAGEISSVQKQIGQVQVKQDTVNVSNVNFVVQKQGFPIAFDCNNNFYISNNKIVKNYGSCDVKKHESFINKSTSLQV